MTNGVTSYLKKCDTYRTKGKYRQEISPNKNNESINIDN